MKVATTTKARTSHAKSAAKHPKRKVAKNTTKRAKMTSKRTMSTKINTKVMPVVPHLEPFSDLEQIRHAVEKYNDAFMINPMATPFGGFGQIIKKYGKIQFAGFLVAALAAKEIYLVDPGTLNLFNTSFVMFSYYVVGQDAVRQSYREFVDNINAKYQDGLKAACAIYEAGIKHCNASLDKPSVIKEANVAFQEAHDALAESRVRVAAQAHKDGILTKLNAIYSQEQIEAKQHADAVRGVALDYLQKNAFTDKVKGEVLTEALSLVGKKTGGQAPEFKALQTLLKDSLATAEAAASKK